MSIGGLTPLALLVVVLGAIGASAAIALLWTRTLRQQVDERVRELAASREEQRRRAEELDSLYQAAVTFASTLDRERIVEFLHDELQRLLPATAIYITLDRGAFAAPSLDVFDQDDRHAWSGLNEAGQDALTGWVMTSRMSLLVHDSEILGSGPPAPLVLRDRPARSWLGVPLVANDRAIGAIVLLSDQPNTYSHREVRLVSTVASQAAVALENARLYSEMHLLAVTDGLTGLHNSRYFYETLDREIVRSARYGHSVSVVMVDIDDFKTFNDSRGHVAGDDLLREISAILVNGTRRSDTVARYGGEEFALTLVETEPVDALALAERIRQLVASRVFKAADLGPVARVTLSAGVASFPKDGATSRRLVAAADRALYAAKRAGKNRVFAASDVLDPTSSADAL